MCSPRPLGSLLRRHAVRLRAPLNTQPLHLTTRQEEEVAGEEEGLATLPRRTGLLVGRRRIRSRMAAEGGDAEGEEAKAWRQSNGFLSSMPRWTQPLPVLATSAASREREASERAVDSTTAGSIRTSWVNSWEMLVEDSEGDFLALLLTFPFP